MSISTTPNSSQPPTVALMRRLGLEPDPWQVEVFEGGHARLLLNCCRQQQQVELLGRLSGEGLECRALLS